MSNSIRNGLIACIGTMFMFYLCGATIAWDFNPGDWSLPLRSGMSIIGFMLSGLIGGIVATETK